MGDEQQFCLRWNNFQANITTQFEALRDEEDFVDVTLACEGQRIKAHKVVLSACSPYFKELFRSNPCKHPILFMRDVEFRHLQSLIEFMYAGEVNVAQAHLSSFLRTAESLQIRGLTEAPQRHKQDPKDKTQNDAASNALIQQLINNARPQSTSPRATSQNNTSSQEEEEEDDILSGSSSLSPPPSKRARDDDESVPQTHLPLTISQPADTAITTHELEPRYNKGPSPEMFQPKTEAPDYNSDGESKGNFLALDNSMLDNSFSSMHGGLDMLAGPSTQAFTGDPTQDAALAAHHQKLHSLDPRPCPICNRMYSNLSNLRQHVRLIHNPQTVACPLCSKPFKTKLYLKRHLMSFHELLWTSTTAGAAAAAKTAGNVAGNVAAAQGAGQFFPSPQGLSTSQPTEDKGSFHGQSPNKCKEASQPTQQEYFQTQRSYQNAPLNGDQTYAPHAGPNNQEMSTFAATQVPKDGDYQRNQDKSRFKPSESDSYIGGITLENEFQSNYVPNNDGMESFNANNQKTGEFMGPMVLGKSVDGQVSYQSSESRDASREGQSAYECSDSSRSHVKQVGHVIE